MKIYGAYCIHNINDRFYLIGELHDTPNLLPCPLDAALKAWNVTECWTELTIVELLTLSIQPGRKHSPITATAHLPTPYTVHPSNVRRMYPYYIIESILDIPVFAMPYLQDNIAFNSRTKTVIKQFEKRLFTVMEHRRTTVALLMSIIDPSKELPGWYQDFLDQFEAIGFTSKDKRNPVHEALINLNTDQRAQILAFAKRTIQATLQAEKEDYFRAMMSLQHTRHTSSDRLKSFFISLFAVVMDVYILARVLATDTPQAVVCGFNHMQRLFEFFRDNGMIQTGWTAFSNDPSYVDMEADRIPLTNVQNPRVPLDELKDFRGQ